MTNKHFMHIQNEKNINMQKLKWGRGGTTGNR